MRTGMMSSLFQRVVHFFRFGRLPDEVKTQLESEGGMLFLAEGVAMTSILTDFKAPGVRCSYRRMTIIGFLALSEQRIVIRAKCWHKIDVNTAFDDPRFKTIAFNSTEKYLSLRFDPSGFIPDASGQVEIRVHVPNVSRAAKILEGKGACMAPENVGS